MSGFWFTTAMLAKQQLDAATRLQGSTSAAAIAIGMPPSEVEIDPPTGSWREYLRTRDAKDNG